jgi:hypothetical protein
MLCKKHDEGAIVRLREDDVTMGLQRADTLLTRR